MNKRYPFNPDYAVPPGETLQEIMDIQGVNSKELAMRTSLSVYQIGQITEGTVPITHDIAILLEGATGIPVSFWEAREDTYRKQLQKVEA